MKLTETFSILEPYDLTLIVLGLGVLGVAALLHRFDGKPFSFPILALTLGWVAYAATPWLPTPDPNTYERWTVHLTELGVIISLMGVGLKIDRPLNLRTWVTAWRLLGVTMVLTIAGVAVLGWWMLGLAPAAAVLLGAVLAPTDPVLAADVQVGEPDEGETDSKPKEREDEVRFALTAEAALNDSLAFPFTYLALLIAAYGVHPSEWLAHWLLIDIGYRIAIGLIAGVLLGSGLARILLPLPVDSELQKMRTGVGALAATLLIYGLTESVGGYGFLAVVIGAVRIRHYEQTHQPHRSLHLFAEQLEQLMLTGILVALGAAVAGGLLKPLSWNHALFSLLLLLVVRPLAGLIGLVGCERLTRLERGIVSFFGIRGIGSLYYLAYALHKEEFAAEEQLWAVCGFVVILSVFVHGITAAPAMQFRARRMKSQDERS